MTDMPAGADSGRAPGGAEPGLVRRRDLLAALDRAARFRAATRLCRRISPDPARPGAWPEPAGAGMSVIAPSPESESGR